MSILTRDASEEKLWSQKYRPQSVDETILPKEIKEQFARMVKDGEIPNLLLASKNPGVGKTTVALALCRELDAEVLFINASLQNGIDTLRNEIVQFCSSFSMSDTKKVVLLDEGDQLSPTVQSALRGVLEEFSNSTSFIITCNFPHKIMEAIRSRLTVVDFTFGSDVKMVLAKSLVNRLFNILKAENVEFVPAVVAEIAKKNFPDFRKTLNELQRFSLNGVIDEGVLATIASETDFDVLFTSIKQKDFKSARKWIGETPDIDYASVYSSIYNSLVPMLEGECVPQTIVTLNEYQYKNSFVVDPELNFVACVLELMAVTNFK